MSRELNLLDDEAGSKKKTFHKGALIYKEGQESNLAYIIKQGRVAIYRVINNKRVNLGVRGPGDIFGEMGVIGAEPRSANAEALEFTEVLILDQALLKTMLLKSPRPVQIIAQYLVNRVKNLTERITDRPAGNMFLAVCRILALCHQAAARAGQTELDLAEVSRTIKDILLINQIEIDEVLDKLQKLHIIELAEVKGAYFRKDPLLGTVKKGTEYVKNRTLRVPDVDKFLQVAKNMALEYRKRGDFTCDLEFVDLAEFADNAQTTPEMIYKKIGYREIPEGMFFFHKPSALAYIERMGPEFFKKAKRPRLSIEDLQSVDDIEAVDNATLQEVFSELGFHKVAVLAAMAGDTAQDKIYKNLSRKIADVVKEEVASGASLDEDEAADVEQELIERIKAIKGLTK